MFSVGNARLRAPVGFPQIRLRSDGRRCDGEPGRAVDKRADSAHLQVSGDQRGSPDRLVLRLHAQRFHGRQRLRGLAQRGSIPRTRAVQGKP